MPPKNHKVKNEQNTISLPYDKHYADKDEEESMKLITELVIHNQGWGYTCFVSAFMIFVSEKEIKVHKSQIIQFFSAINTAESFEALNLPILKITDCGDGTANKAYEIDLSKKAQILKAMNVAKFDCYPVLWIQSVPS